MKKLTENLLVSYISNSNFRLNESFLSIKFLSTQSREWFKQQQTLNKWIRDCIRDNFKIAIEITLGIIYDHIAKDIRIRTKSDSYK